MTSPEGVEPTTLSVVEEFGLDIEVLSDDEVRLPVGMSRGGDLITTARVRAVTGGDRKKATGGKAQRSAAHMMTALLEACVIDLGGQRPTKHDVRRLTEPDRSLLAAEIRRRTYPGEKIMITAECDPKTGGCGSKWDFFLDLDELTINYASDIKWIDGLPCFIVNDEGINLKATMHYLLGEDSESMAGQFKDRDMDTVSPAELMDATVLSMLMDINGKEIRPEQYDRLPPIVHSTFEQSIIDNRAGPDLEILSTCKKCKKAMNPEVNIVDFLLRGRAKKVSKR